MSDQASRLRLLVESSQPHAGQTGPSRAAAPAPAHASLLLVIASGKGGVGKSNLAVNLAIAFAKRRLRTALIDADLGVANADVLCGLSPRRRLDPLAATPLDLDALALQAPGGFTLIPGTLGVGAAADLAPPQRERLLHGLAHLESQSDVLIVDASPGVGPLVTRLLTAADIGLIVTTPEPTAITDAYALVKCVRAAEAPAAPPANLHLVVNNAADRHQAEAATARIQAATEHFLRRRLPSLGWIAHDPHLPAAVFARHPVLLRSPRAPVSRALDRLASSILDQWLPSAAHPPTTGTPPLVAVPPVTQQVEARPPSRWIWPWSKARGAHAR